MNFEVDFNGKVQLGEILAVGAPKKKRGPENGHDDELAQPNS